MVHQKILCITENCLCTSHKHFVCISYSLTNILRDFLISNLLLFEYTMNILIFIYGHFFRNRSFQQNFSFNEIHNIIFEIFLPFSLSLYLCLTLSLHHFSCLSLFSFSHHAPRHLPKTHLATWREAKSNFNLAMRKGTEINRMRRRPL